jgi:hypothetical protein
VKTPLFRLIRFFRTHTVEVRYRGVGKYLDIAKGEIPIDKAETSFSISKYKKVSNKRNKEDYNTPLSPVDEEQTQGAGCEISELSEISPAADSVRRGEKSEISEISPLGEYPNADLWEQRRHKWYRRLQERSPWLATPREPLAPGKCKHNYTPSLCHLGCGGEEN